MIIEIPSNDFSQLLLCPYRSGVVFQFSSANKENEYSTAKTTSDGKQRRQWIEEFSRPKLVVVPRLMVDG